MVATDSIIRARNSSKLTRYVMKESSITSRTTYTLASCTLSNVFLTQHDMLPQHPGYRKEKIKLWMFQYNFSKEERNSVRMI